MKTLLFLCTGNYYRSRFAELYFRHLATEYEINWHVDSRGLQLFSDNEGSLSQHTVSECEKFGISTEPLRLPMSLREDDLVRAEVTIAVKETEHRPLIRKMFPHWEERIEFWRSTIWMLPRQTKHSPSYDCTLIRSLSGCAHKRCRSHDRTDHDAKD